MKTITRRELRKNITQILLEEESHFIIDKVKEIQARRSGINIFVWSPTQYLSYYLRENLTEDDVLVESVLVGDTLPVKWGACDIRQIVHDGNDTPNQITPFSDLRFDLIVVSEKIREKDTCAYLAALMLAEGGVLIQSSNIDRKRLYNYQNYFDSNSFVYWNDKNRATYFLTSPKMKQLVNGDGRPKLETDKSLFVPDFVEVDNLPVHTFDTNVSFSSLSKDKKGKYLIVQTHVGNPIQSKHLIESLHSMYSFSKNNGLDYVFYMVDDRDFYRDICTRINSSNITHLTSLGLLKFSSWVRLFNENPDFLEYDRILMMDTDILANAKVTNGKELLDSLRKDMFYFLPINEMSGVCINEGILFVSPMYYTTTALIYRSLLNSEIRQLIPTTDNTDVMTFYKKACSILSESDTKNGWAWLPKEARGEYCSFRDAAKLTENGYTISEATVMYWVASTRLFCTNAAFYPPEISTIVGDSRMRDRMLFLHYFGFISRDFSESLMRSVSEHQFINTERVDCKPIKSAKLHKAYNIAITMKEYPKIAASFEPFISRALEGVELEKNLPSFGVCTVALLRENLPFLEWWISHHKTIGASKITIYANDGSTGSEKSVSLFKGTPFVRRAISKRGERYGDYTAHLTDEDVWKEANKIAARIEGVEIVRWNPVDKEGNVIHGQREAYKDWIRKNRYDLMFGIFIDVDEFVSVADGISLRHTMTQMLKQKIGIGTIQPYNFKCRWTDDGKPETVENLVKFHEARTEEQSSKAIVLLNTVTGVNIHLSWTCAIPASVQSIDKNDIFLCHFSKLELESQVSDIDYFNYRYAHSFDKVARFHPQSLYVEVHQPDPIDI